MPFRSRDNLASRRSDLLFSYVAASLSATAISTIGNAPSFRTPILGFAVATAVAAILFLVRFLRSNDEREQQINYRALTFAFATTLIFSLAVDFSQALG